MYVQRDGYFLKCVKDINTKSLRVTDLCKVAFKNKSLIVTFLVRSSFRS